MKKTYLIITTIFLVLGTLASCHKNVIDDTDNLDGENGFIEDPNSMFSYAKIPSLYPILLVKYFRISKKLLIPTIIVS